jgi:hypothetical protein
MSTRARISVGAAGVGVFLAFLAPIAPAAAKPKPITGKLSKPGYTVIALAASGKATSAQAKRGKFRLKPPSDRVTLQLRAGDGTYAGPIVIAGRGKSAIVGVKAGAKLGKIKVKPGKGFAKLKRSLPQRFVDHGQKARAKGGVPIGAGNFGRVRSQNTHGGAPGDADLDGIPNPLDIDDDGDLILDDLDSSTAARVSQAANEFQLHSSLPLPPEAVVNANAAALSTSQIDQALSTWGYLSMSVQPGAELDCGGVPDPANPAGWSGGLSYCTRGGTGSVFSAPPPRPAFPECCDPDSDGFGTPPNSSFGGALPGFSLSHGATTAQIGTGDLLTQCLPGCREGGSEILATLQFVFATTPALVSYSDTAGNSASVSYPVGPGDPGTNNNGFPVGAPPGQDIVLTLTSWRPQRERLSADPAPRPGESGTWTDIGGLTYEAIVQHIGPVLGGQEVGRPCPQSSLSSSDLTLGSPDPHFSPDTGRLVDPAADRPASPAHTYAYSLNVTQCLASLGVVWNPGEDMGLTLEGVSPNVAGDAEETVVFRRQP